MKVMIGSICEQDLDLFLLEGIVSSDPDERLAYKLHLIRAALVKHRLGYNLQESGAG